MTYVGAVRAALADVGDPERAAQQRAYMKSTLPYVGLAAPELRALLRPILAEHRFIDRAQWEDAARELWEDATHRDEWYAAIALLRYRHYRAWVEADLLPLLEEQVRTGAWWDVVDEIAVHLVGPILLADRSRVTPLLEGWADDRDSLWIRRTAMIAQLRHREETDAELLERVLTRNGIGSRFGKEFFIRKALGWALREHAKVDAEWVRDFVSEHGERLSPLSRREALKHVVNQTGTSSTAPTA